MQVPEDVKHARFDRLVEHVDRISAEKNAAYEGRTLWVMIEGASKRDAGAVSGRTDGFKLVNISLAEESLPEELRGKAAGQLCTELTGRFVEVSITKGKTFSLEGVLTGRME